MKLLIVGDIGTLDRLEEQAIVSKTKLMNHNACLFTKDHALSVVNDEGICLGKYYWEVPPHDSRWSGKTDLFDVVVEIGSNRMQFLCSESLYMSVDNAPTLFNLLKKVENERSSSRGSDTSKEVGKSNKVDAPSDKSKGLPQ